MKIAVISTTVMVCPVPGYGGLEQIAWQQADGLAKKGHKVLLVAPKGSTPPDGVELHGTTLGESEKQAYSGYWQRLVGQDAVVDHSWNKWSAVLRVEGRLKAPSLLWLHAPVEAMFSTPPPVEKPCLVAISKDQAGATFGHLGMPAKVCYNGIDLDSYKPNGSKKTDRYLFLARMSKLKGPHVAVAVAKKCGVPLDLVGDDKLVEDPGYARRIKDSCEGSRIVYHGEKSRKDCAVFFSEAKALLHCNFVFREPFGLSPVESMACGTPVIAADHGAMRETVKHDETGFLVRTEEEIESLVKDDAVRSIRSEACREWAGQFSLGRMVDRCEAMCVEAVETGGW